MPVFKDKGSPLQCMNYRPISLLSNINNIHEKLMYSRLYNFLNLHNCIYDLQFGFRGKHSTNHALLSLAENIRGALDNNNFVSEIFIDLQKAFDTVDHPRLLNKLKHYGIIGKANDWFKSYFKIFQTELYAFSDPQNKRIDIFLLSCIFLQWFVR